MSHCILMISMTNWEILPIVLLDSLFVRIEGVTGVRRSHNNWMMDIGGGLGLCVQGTR